MVWSGPFNNLGRLGRVEDAFMMVLGLQLT